METLLPETVAVGLLETAAGAWDDDEAQRVPTRQQITWGEPPWDAPDSLYVGILSIGTDNLVRVNQPGNCSVVPDLAFRLLLARAWAPTSRDYDEQSREEEAHARALLRDGALLWTTLARAWGDGELFNGRYLPACERVRFGPLEAKGPGGQLAGWTWQVTVEASARLP